MIKFGLFKDGACMPYAWALGVDDFDFIGRTLSFTFFTLDQQIYWLNTFADAIVKESIFYFNVQMSGCEMYLRGYKCVSVDPISSVRVRLSFMPENQK